MREAIWAAIIFVAFVVVSFYDPVAARAVAAWLAAIKR